MTFADDMQKAFNGEEVSLLQDQAARKKAQPSTSTTATHKLKVFGQFCLGTFLTTAGATFLVTCAWFVKTIATIMF